MTAQSAATVLGLVEDDALQLILQPQLWPVAERWVPRGLEPPSRAADAVIHVGASHAPLSRPAGEPTLRLGHMAAWVDDQGDVVVLRGRAPANGGTVSFRAGRALLSVNPDLTGEAAADVYTMLTVSAALLLASLRRALVHAAAVVTPEGDGWLLVGDARAGKSTTCATLAVGGWGFLSDDQVILSQDPGRGTGVAVEGWLRPFHLDSADARGHPTGERHEVHPAELGLHRWRRRAAFAGVILPVVSAAEPTRLASVTAADALAGLVRQSPWLLACRRSAPEVLDLLTRAATGGGAYSLRLGRDTFRGPKRLSECLGGLGSREQGAGSRRGDVHENERRREGMVTTDSDGCEDSAHAQVPLPSRVAASTQPGGPHA